MDVDQSSLFASLCGILLYIFKFEELLFLLFGVHVLLSRIQIKNSSTNHAVKVVTLGDDRPLEFFIT